MSVLRSRIPDFWRGHLFLFDKPQAMHYSTQAGGRLLWLFLGLEIIARPLVNAGAHRVTIAERTWWPLVYVTLFTLAACWLVLRFARVSLTQLGLRPWRRWSRIEKFYFAQTIPLAIVVFSIFRWTSLRALPSRTDLGEIALFIFVPQVIWGFYQEFMYRGALQTELVRRWGATKGILASNVIFTFGPLHAHHFLAAQANPSHLWMFAAVFSIGLLFAVLFWRSGNLALVGIMHGLGDWFMGGLAQVSRLAP